MDRVEEQELLNYIMLMMQNQKLMILALTDMQQKLVLLQAGQSYDRGEMAKVEKVR